MNIHKYSSRGWGGDTKMPAGPVLSEAEKEKNKKQLQSLCTKHWIVKGYKKTSIKELCEDTGISVGTFYNLYPSKEDLFFETIDAIQKRLEKQILAIVQNTPTMTGFASAIKAIVREYDKMPFLYEANSPDFLSFITKLSEETMEKLKNDRINFLRNIIRMTNLELNVNEHEAQGSISALLSTIHARETISLACDYFKVFDFMVDSLIPNIFREQ